MLNQCMPHKSYPVQEAAFAMLYVFLISKNYLYIKQLLPGFLVNSADYHPEEELFPEGYAPNNSFEG